MPAGVSWLTLSPSPYPLPPGEREKGADLRPTGEREEGANPLPPEARESGGAACRPSLTGRQPPLATSLNTLLAVSSDSRTSGRPT